MRSVAAVLVLMVLGAGRAGAQLISPGKMSAAHANLEGLRGCTNCHDLGRKGASSAKCLDCHGPLNTRIGQGRGFHSTVEGECADCHKEHLGREFDLARLDTVAFDHTRTGYRLQGGHDGTACLACHSAANVVAPDVREWIREHEAARPTLLGLSTTCTGCHAPDDPHRDQFKQACDACHDSGEWSRPVRFEHSRTAYALTGRHRDAPCEGCHRAERSGSGPFVRYKGVAAGTCTSCHRDEHEGVMGSGCTTCHETGGWAAVDRGAVENRFDHARTRFPLRGLHGAADCVACHSASADRPGIRLHFGRIPRGASYPKPASDGCAACHVDYHDGTFARSAGGIACDGCHGEAGWQPASFDIERHNSAATFELTGAHVATPCTACHTAESATAKPRFHFEVRDCAACHKVDSPHGGQFADRQCAECHQTDSFVVTDFDHDSAVDERCLSCHEDDDPHADQFEGADCQACHSTASFRIDDFDHSTTRFELDGEHIAVDCAGCHTERDVAGRIIVQYRPLPSS